MVQLKVNIYDDHAGDLEVDVEVAGPAPELVMYDEYDLAVRLGMEEVPAHTDKDLRERAAEAYIDYLLDKEEVASVC